MFVIDVETAPIKNRITSIDERYLPKIDARLVDPEKISAATAELESEMIKAKSLDPDFGRLVSIGVIDISHKNKNGEYNEYMLSGEDEHLLLTRFWNLNKELGNVGFQTVGFNTLNFDLPFIYRRSLYNEVDVPYPINLRRFVYYPHFDILQALSNWGGAKAKSLDFYAQAFCLDVSKFGGGSDIYEWYKKGDWASIEEHNIQDCRITKDLYFIIKDMYPANQPTKYDRGRNGNY